MLEAGLHNRSGVVRKTSAFLLRAPKRMALARAKPEEYRLLPPVIANSIPKSGTHLLDQIVAGLPGRANFGSFVASLTSSFTLRERTVDETVRLIRQATPGELVRGHLYFQPEYAEAFASRNVAHYFIYRDPRDVIVSSCHYLREMNPWHRYHKYFKACATLEDAILLSIRGLKDESSKDLVPSMLERFLPYEGWITHPSVCAVKFEDLRGDGLEANLARIVDFYAERSATPIDCAATLAVVRASIAPEKSHTFRAGKKGGWSEAFTPACREAFKEVAGDMLVRLGYERGNDW